VVILIEAFFLHRQTSDHRPSATQLAGAMVTVLGGSLALAGWSDGKANAINPPQFSSIFWTWVVNSHPELKVYYCGLPQ